VPTTGDGPAADAPAHLPSGAERRRNPFLRPAPLLGAVAAAAAVVVGVIVVTTGDDEAGPQFEAALGGTELAPDASGTATLTRTDSGWEIELDAPGLPRLDGGEFYQAWLRGPDDVLVPIGSFNEGTDVILWAGVSPEDFGTLTVTREAADGDQASSGERVLAGEVEPAED
jgi:hypothetical protein